MAQTRCGKLRLTFSKRLWLQCLAQLIRKFSSSNSLRKEQHCVSDELEIPQYNLGWCNTARISRCDVKSIFDYCAINRESSPWLTKRSRSTLGNRGTNCGIQPLRKRARSPTHFHHLLSLESFAKQGCVLHRSSNTMFRHLLFRTSLNIALDYGDYRCWHGSLLLGCGQRGLMLRRTYSLLCQRSLLAFRNQVLIKA